MSYKSRIKKIENNLNLNSGMRFKDLLNPNFKITGNPFNSVQAIFNYFNLTEKVPDYNDEIVIKLIMNKLLSGDSHKMRILKERATAEMQANM